MGASLLDRTALSKRDLTLEQVLDGNELLVFLAPECHISNGVEVDRASIGAPPRKTGNVSINIERHVLVEAVPFELFFRADSSIACRLVEGGRLRRANFVFELLRTGSKVHL